MTSAAALAHIPGPPPKPFVGHTLVALSDSYGAQKRTIETYGEIYKVKILGRWRVNIAGPDALEFILGDRDRLFSSKDAWQQVADMFSGGLALRDFDDHRRHRRIMQAAFRAPAMRDYLARMNGQIGRMLADWPTGRAFAFYPAIKDLTMRLGNHVFAGLPPDSAEADRLNRAFTDEVRASFAIVRLPLVFNKYGRGIAGRRYMTRRLTRLIAERRDAPGDDFFSQMCAATDDEGQGWTDAEIVDHFNFLMTAAHDTTASSLATIVWALGAHPEWQDRLADEVAALGGGPPGTEALAGMELTERVFKEALRLVPPVPFIPRRAVRDFTWKGVFVPGGTAVTAGVGYVHMMPELYPDPEAFDPDRFAPDRAEDQRHRYAFAPFGGGAHKCIGMHFATMQVKAFTAALLSRYRVRLACDPAPDWVRLPIPRPRNGLPVVLTPRVA